MIFDTEKWNKEKLSGCVYMMNFGKPAGMMDRFLNDNRRHAAHVRRRADTPLATTPNPT